MFPDGSNSSQFFGHYAGAKSFRRFVRCSAQPLKTTKLHMILRRTSNRSQPRRLGTTAGPLEEISAYEDRASFGNEALAGNGFIALYHTACRKEDVVRLIPSI